MNYKIVTLPNHSCQFYSSAEDVKYSSAVLHETVVLFLYSSSIPTQAIAEVNKEVQKTVGTVDGG